MNIFTAEANDELRNLVRLSVRQVLNTLVNSYPRYLLPISNRFNYVYHALLLLAVDGPCLLISRSTFSEYFYSLQRTCLEGASWKRSALEASSLLGVELLQSELEESRRFKILASCLRALNVCYKLLFVVGKSQYVSFVDHLLRVRYTYANQAMAKSSLLLTTLMLSLKFLQFYHSVYLPANRSTLVIPPPEKPAWTLSENASEEKSGRCPHCQRSFATFGNAVVLRQSGIVVCSSCASLKYPLESLTRLVD